MVGAPLLSNAQTGPGGLGIAGGRWACQVAARTPPLRTLTPQVAARASRPHRHLKGPPAHGRATTPQSTQPPCHTVVHYTPNTPCHPHFTEVDCTLSKHSGGFATIDPRHAGDTPQSSAYGSNSPQATNENKPHHHNKHTKTCRTRPTPHHLRHRQQPHPLKHPQHRPRRPRNTTRRRNHAQPVVHYTPHTPCHPHSTEVDCTLSNHAGGFTTIDPRHADDTPQRSAYGSNSPQATTRGCNRATAQPRAGGTPRGYSKRGRHQPTPCASALTRP